MTTASANTADQASAQVIIPGDLALSAAAELRGSVLKTMDAAPGELVVELDTADPGMCALQFLIAIHRSADSRGLNLRLSEHAAVVLDGIDLK